MPTDIPADKCTHLSYSSIAAEAGGNIKSFKDAAILQSMVGLRNQNPNLKLFVSIAASGAGPNSTIFTEV